VRPTPDLLWTGRQRANRPRSSGHERRGSWAGLPQAGNPAITSPSRPGVTLTDQRRTRTPTYPPGPGEPRATAGIEDLRALGATTDVVTAGRFLGISRNTAYRLARRGDFPVPIVRVGAQYRVPTAALIAVLHPQPAEPATAGREAPQPPNQPT
jgi:hypothetical protein